jgi:hypothetical protein
MLPLFLAFSSSFGFLLLPTFFVLFCRFAMPSIFRISPLVLFSFLLIPIPERGDEKRVRKGRIPEAALRLSHPYMFCIASRRG